MRDLLVIYRRRRKIIYGTLLVFALLGAIYCTVCTRRYEATAVLQVQKESADAMGLDSLMSGAEGASDALGANIDLQTQANILQSDTLALRTIEDLQMEGTYDFKQRWNPVGMVLGWVSPAAKPDPPHVTLDNAPERRRRALKVFARNLKVKPVSGTRLIEIDYRNPDANLAAAVVNKLMQALVDYTFQTRYNATNQASQWLSGQLGELRQQSEALQARVAALQKQSGVYSLGTADASGRELAYSGVLDRLQQATLAMTAAEQNRILKGAVAHAADTNDAEMLSGLAGNLLNGQSQSVSNSLAVIQNLREQEATAQGSLQQLEAKFGPAYPRVIELRGQIAGLNKSIEQEIGRIRHRAESDAAVANQTAIETKVQYNEAKQAADQLNDKAVEYTIVHQEAEESRELYEDLLKRLKEAGVLEGLKSSNITVVDPGRTPSKPVKPNVPLYMAIALAGGFFLGSCGAWLTDTLDNKINSIQDLEETTGQTVLGALPTISGKEKRRGKGHVVVIDSPQSTYAEAVRAIRTSLLLWKTDAPPQVILVTSSIAGEGKSALSVNLATVLTQHDHHVLLVDADLRRGTISNRLDLPPGPGLSALLSGQWKGEAFPSVEGAAGLEVLQTGPLPPNPSELLDSRTMRMVLDFWRGQYDFVILDGAPVLPVTDSVTLNAMVDATLLVVRSGMTEKPHVKRSYALLTKNHHHPVGVVLNGLGADGGSYYGYYGYRKNVYGKESEDA